MENSNEIQDDDQNIHFYFDYERNNYLHFINRLRSCLTDHHIFEIPVLVAQSDPPNVTFVDVHLHFMEENKVLTVRMRKLNMYIIGYRPDGGSFWELQFPNEPSPLFEQSKKLGFEGGYTGASSLCDLAGLKICGRNLGFHSLKDAVCELGRLETPNEGKGINKAAKHIMTVIPMVAEAARIIPLARHFSENWKTNKDYVPDVMKNLINDWSDFSKLVCQAETADAVFKPIKLSHINSIEVVRDTYAILLHCFPKEKSPEKNPKKSGKKKLGNSNFGKKLLQ